MPPLFVTSIFTGHGRHHPGGAPQFGNLVAGEVRRNGGLQNGSSNSMLPSVLRRAASGALAAEIALMRRTDMGHFLVLGSPHRYLAMLRFVSVLSR